MTEWWVSQAKHWCKICKVWTGGHIRQIKKHEEGRAHIENEEKHIKDSKARAKAKEAEEQDVLAQLAEIERKAAAAMVAQPTEVSCGLGVAQAPLDPGIRQLEQAAQKRQIEDVIAGAKRQKTDGAPSAWTRHVDPNSKASYYYNSVTKESSWVEPEGFVEHPATQTQTSQDGPSGNGSPWTACTDVNSGCQYYYNSVTKESRWERPPDFEPPKAQQIASTESIRVETSVANVPAKAAASQPVVSSPSPQPTIGPAIASGASAANAPASAGSPWVVCTDHSTGYVYYFNKITKASSWEQPADLGVDLSKPPPPPSQKPPPPPKRPSASKAVDETVPNIGGWEEVKPEDSMWKPKDPNDPESDDEKKEVDPLIAMKYLTAQRGAWMDEDYERHSKQMEIKPQASSGGPVSFATRKKASGIRKKDEEE